MTHTEIMEKAYNLIYDYVYLQEVTPAHMKEIEKTIKQARQKLEEEYGVKD